MLPNPDTPLFGHSPKIELPLAPTLASKRLPGTFAVCLTHNFSMCIIITDLCCSDDTGQADAARLRNGNVGRAADEIARTGRMDKL